MTSDLITRLSKLDAPDREVDGEIWRYLMSGEPRAALHGPIPKLTGSIDAVITEAEKGLPGWDHGYDKLDDDQAVGKFWRRGWREVTAVYGYAATPAIALCIALLRAKEASNAE